MNLGTIHANPHLHLWTRSLDGAEFANAIYENHIDAALDFCAITQHIRKYTDGDPVTIEYVMESLEEGKGMYVGSHGLLLVLSKCEGGCKSASWN